MAADVSTQAKTCYYVLLGVDRQATGDELRKAYKRKALELHPDKNRDRIDEATQQFTQVREAYETLSDPQERAFYDSHRDAILNPTDPASEAFMSEMGVTSDATLMTYFSASRFARHDPDSAYGFYGLYATLFHQLGLEEIDAMYNDPLSPRYGHAEHARFPPFGTSTTPDDAVRAFYASWSAFTTAKSYRWCDKWRTGDAPDRRLRRLVERDNAKLREQGRSGFVATVRALVRFVQKRDPRWKAMAEVERAAAAERVRDAAARRAAHEARQRDAVAAQRAAQARDAAAYVAPAWTREEDAADGIEAGLGAAVLAHEVDEEALRCAVCDKTFRTAKQRRAHDVGLPHRAAVARVREALLADERAFGMAAPAGETADSHDPLLAAAFSKGGENATREPDAVDSDAALNRC
ncbi:hypothetical protein CXG81DRAFT_17262 [Caulochytrium protostelioides]|uniref:J domain-containing protein n=1 Tax=Caulochytrium protostelioides TaxID=1555241 RepID=A0A4P9XCN3_9FUNG|nr:hypothetical protein CXG81DRAFT_17262 [Caulochytrium protostelioides]|eukprot:RKP03206.1 hypothetical protein CXG81DRAFT_17262 [Caulochytrium protostelioides]